MAVLTISIDLTKNEFQIHGLGAYYREGDR
ncbi:hypothetical protein G684_02166 [Escherichia coli HVH 4 (4-7276109)]|nr:hypothetical protein G684_02166 [Escherichia coli HVH 4 (4-7276109)]